MDIVVWLRSLGLGKYEAAFAYGSSSATACTCGHQGRGAAHGAEFR